MTSPNQWPVLDYRHCVAAAQSGGMIERLEPGGRATLTGHTPRLGLPTININRIGTLGVIVDDKNSQTNI